MALEVVAQNARMLMEIHSLLVGDAKGRRNDILQLHKGEFLVGAGIPGHRHVHRSLGRIGSTILIIPPVHDFTGDGVGRATLLSLWCGSG